MKRFALIPFLAALLGAVVAVAVIAAFGGLEKGRASTVTTLQAPSIARNNTLSPSVEAIGRANASPRVRTGAQRRIFGDRRC